MAGGDLIWIAEADDWADPEYGAGCHPSRAVALARALTEAAQARVSFIAGSRDDMGAALYEPDVRASRRAACVEAMRSHARSRRFADVPDRDAGVGLTMAVQASGAFTRMTVLEELDMGPVLEAARTAAKVYEPAG